MEELEKYKVADNVIFAIPANDVDSYNYKSFKDAIENNIRTNQSKKTSFIKRIFNT